MAVDDPFLEHSLPAESRSQIAADRHSSRSCETEPFAAQITFEQLQDVQETVLGPPIVRHPHAGRAELEISHHLERNVPKRLGNSLGVLANGERFLRMPRHPEVVAHKDGRLAESPLIAEFPGQAFGFVEMVEDPLEFSERQERSPQLKAKIDGLLQRLAGLRLRLKEMQRLLEGGDSLAVGPSRVRKPTRLEPPADRLARTPGLG